MLEITDICNTIIIVLFSFISSMKEQRVFFLLMNNKKS